MLTVQEALSRILLEIPSNSTERIPLEQASGRVLAEPICASIDLPPWDNSAMDGYAVLAADVPGRLKVLETIGAGKVPTQKVVSGTATRLMTGAPMPAGADAVVMVEDTTLQGDEVIVSVKARVGQHIRKQGSDARQGQELLPAGRVLSPNALGLCAAVGVSRVRVWARPRVAILSTGDEIVEAGKMLAPGQIWSSNSTALSALVEQAGGIAVDLGNVPDNPEAITESFKEGSRFDLLISTGGVSVGDFDFVKGAMQDAGASLDFWKVWIKPGKPLAFGRVAGKPVFGLPGNPVSCVVNFLQFVRPVIRMMLGDPLPFLPVLKATLTAPIKRKPDRPELIRVRLSLGEAGILATVVGHQGSGNLAALAEAHGFVMVDAPVSELSGKVLVQLFDTSFLAAGVPHYPWPATLPADSHDHC
jgi:molybdopterin molybdotransferase